MQIPMEAPALLEQNFLEIRARILEVAAALDRIGRANGSVQGDPRMRRISEAIDTLKRPDADRAEQIQVLFSREYDDQWQEKFTV